MPSVPWSRVASRLRDDTAPGIALLAATVAAMVWANLASGTYHDAWNAVLTLPGPEHGLTLRQWVSDGLMAVFFFVVGLEITREVREGELRDPRAAAVPIAAAVGGMVVPALVYALATHGSAAGHGWGVPMATDIAFALAVLRVAGRQVRGLPVTLLTLAVVDDLGAIAVIAVFYSTGVDPAWLLVGVGGLVGIVALRRVADHPAWYVLPAIVVWIAFERSGVHATIAGVALGVVTPLRTRRGRPVLEPLERRLRPWVDFGVLPLFALANVGVAISLGRLGDTLSSRITLGIVLGLVVGKLVGIVGGAHLALRLGGRLADGMTGRSILALGLLGGIGFTVSLFLAGLTFSGADLDVAKLAILGASGAAAIAAACVLRTIRPVPDGAT